MKWLRVALGDLVRGLLAIGIVVAVLSPLVAAWMLFPDVMLIVTSVVVALIVLVAIGAALREEELL